jgi:hypothetical protein
VLWESLEHTDFKASSACTRVVESDERVLAMQSLKSIAAGLLRQASAKMMLPVTQPLRLKVNRQTHTGYSLVNVNGGSSYVSMCETN